MLLLRSSPRSVAKFVLKIGLSVLLFLFLQIRSSVLAIHLPNEPVRNLCSNQRISLSSSLRQGGLILAIGFHPEEQATIEKGITALLTVGKESSDILVLEVPVIDLKYKVFKSSIEPIMRRKVVNQSNCQYIFPLYSNVSDFRKQLGLNDKVNQVFIYITPAGQIAWKESAPLTSAKLQRLKTLLK